MPKNNILLSVRVTAETKDKLDQLCEHLENQLGFKPTQAQALEFALKHALEINLKAKEPRASANTKPAKPTRSKPDPEPEIDYNAIPDETNPHKLDLKGRYAQMCVSDVMQDTHSDWTALPFRFLYEIYKNWVKTSDDPNKESPLNLNQFISRVRLGQNTPILANIFENWSIDENGDDASEKTDGTQPLLEQYDLTDWLKANPEVRTRFQGFVKN